MGRVEGPAGEPSRSTTGTYAFIGPRPPCLIQRVVELVRIHRMDAVAKDAEIMVLRHQLAVLSRQVARPRFAWSDWALIAIWAKLVPRERWMPFLVTPETILRWHRALVRRRWTFPDRRPAKMSTRRSNWKRRLSLRRPPVMVTAETTQMPHPVVLRGMCVHPGRHETG